MYGNTNYSASQYGHEAESGRRSREQDRGGDEDRVTPREAFGSGIRLATQQDVHEGRARFLWDPVPDVDGSFAATHGWAELRKDVAFRISREGHTLRGDLLDPNAEADLRLELDRIVRDDERVLAINDISIYPGRGPDTVETEFVVTGEGGVEHDGVFGYDFAESAMTGTA